MEIKKISVQRNRNRTRLNPLFITFKFCFCWKASYTFDKQCTRIIYGRSWCTVYIGMRWRTNRCSIKPDVIVSSRIPLARISRCREKLTTMPVALHSVAFRRFQGILSSLLAGKPAKTGAFCGNDSDNSVVSERIAFHFPPIVDRGSLSTGMQ